jgi:hypothetical protein
MRRCGVGGEDRGIVLGIAFRRWIDGAGPSDSVDILDEDPEIDVEERVCMDVMRTGPDMLTISRIG